MIENMTPENTSQENKRYRQSNLKPVYVNSKPNFWYKNAIPKC